MPSMSWLTRPLGLGSSKEKEALRSENDWLRDELRKTILELIDSKKSAKSLESSLTESHNSLRLAETEWKRHQDESTRLGLDLDLERAGNTGTREDLVRKERFVSRILAVCDEEIHGKEPLNYASTSGTAGTASTSSDPFIGLPYVSIIIDGDSDSYTFPRRIYSHGEAGGKKAAQLLESDARRYIRTQAGVPQSYELKIQIVLNLTNAISRLGSSFAACLQGFLKTNALFDIIDSGSGKERADDKIRDRLRLDIRSRDCALVIFGGCHDSGYIPILERFVTNGTTKSRLRLLIAENTFLQYQGFDLNWAEFPSIFPECPFAKINKNGKLIKTGKPPPLLCRRDDRAAAPKTQAIKQAVQTPTGPKQGPKNRGKSKRN